MSDLFEVPKPKTHRWPIDIDACIMAMMSEAAEFSCKWVKFLHNKQKKGGWRAYLVGVSALRAEVSEGSIPCRIPDGC